MLFVQHHIGDPVEQPRPVLRSHQHYRETSDFLSLYQCDSLEKLIKGAEAARQHYEPLCILHEHHLADEEIVVRDKLVAVNIGVCLLLKRQVYVDTY